METVRGAELPEPSPSTIKPSTLYINFVRCLASRAGGRKNVANGLEPRWHVCASGLKPCTIKTYDVLFKCVYTNYI